MKKTISLESNSPRGQEALDFAKSYNVPVHFFGNYVEGKYQSPPETPTVEAAEEAVASGTVSLGNAYVKGGTCGDFVIVADGPQKRILDADGDTLIDLEPADNEQTALRYLAGLQHGRKDGVAIGRAQREREISSVASLFLGPVADKLERIAATLEEKHA